MRQVEVAVIGCGWCGGIRAESLAKSALVDRLHLCEIKPDRLAEVAALTNPATATLDYQEIIANPAIEVVYISTTPEGSTRMFSRRLIRPFTVPRMTRSSSPLTSPSMTMLLPMTVCAIFGSLSR